MCTQVFLRESLRLHDVADVRHHGVDLSPDEKNEFHQQSRPGHPVFHKQSSSDPHIWHSDRTDPAGGLRADRKPDLHKKGNLI